MTADTASNTQTTLSHHLLSVGNSDVDEVLADYSADSVLYTQGGPVRGLKALREFFVEFFATVPPAFGDEFELVRQDVDGEIAYVVWRAGKAAPLGADTLIVRDGKIAVETFAAFIHATG